MGKMQDAGKNLKNLADEAKDELDSAGENLKNVANETVTKVEQATDDFKNDFDSHFKKTKKVASDADGMGQATEHTKRDGDDRSDKSYDEEDMDDHSGSVADKTAE